MNYSAHQLETLRKEICHHKVGISGHGGFQETRKKLLLSLFFDKNNDRISVPKKGRTKLEQHYYGKNKEKIEAYGKYFGFGEEEFKKSFREGLIRLFKTIERSDSKGNAGGYSMNTIGSMFVVYILLLLRIWKKYKIQSKEKISTTLILHCISNPHLLPIDIFFTLQKEYQSDIFFKILDEKNTSKIANKKEVSFVTNNLLRKSIMTNPTDPRAFVEQFKKNVAYFLAEYPLILPQKVIRACRLSQEPDTIKIELGVFK